MRQIFETAYLDDVASETRLQLDRLFRSAHPTPGKSVAITAGSRGIRNIDTILKTVVEYFCELGLEPFLVPAMGSHGGATAKGQTALLAQYGITEKTVGCPIRSSMETVVLDSLTFPHGETIPIHFDRCAAEADHVFLVNRIKPHTRFTGPIESGLSKMLMVGLGKETGATLYHRYVPVGSFETAIRKVVSLIRSRISLLGGLGIVENAQDQTAILRATPPESIEKTDEELLVFAKSRMPRIPFDEIDLLLIDRIGKNISGTGMDTNVVGRKSDDRRTVPGEKPVVHRIAVCDLTPETGGNANGIGLADYCLAAAVEKMDRNETRINAIAANRPHAAEIPQVFFTEQEILEAALKENGVGNAEEMHTLWIRDTLHLETLLCSESLREQAKVLELQGKLKILDHESIVP
ncbi:MAG: [Fe-S]-binding protein [Planctomycetaceae bacterium]|nr:[Fe-S]-binding protein [Planctomycetaceae bacterium]